MDSHVCILRFNRDTHERTHEYQAASTRCSGNNKEKLSTNIRREYASDFCHNRKSTFKVLRDSLLIQEFVHTHYSLASVQLPLT